MIARLSLFKKLFILTLVPLLAFCYVSFSELGGILKQSETLERTNSFHHAAENIGELLHELQKERGLTAAFLGAGGEQGKEQLSMQRAKTDQVVADFTMKIKELPKDHFPEKSSQKFQEIFYNLDVLADHRSKIDRLAIVQAKALGHYTQTNALGLEIVLDLVANATIEGVANELFSLFSMLSIKEKAGIERAVFSAVFAQNEYRRGQKEKLVELISSQKVLTDFFFSLASAKQIDRFKVGMNASFISQFEAMRQKGLDEQKDFGIDAMEWFSIATKRVNFLQEMEQGINEGLSHMIDEKIEKDRLLMVRNIAVTILSLILVIGLGVYMSRLILHPLGGEPNEMQSIAESIAQGNLSIQFDNQKKEPRGLFAAMQSMSRDLNQTIGKVVEGSNSLQVSTGLLNEISSQLSNTSEEMTQQANAVASSSDEINSNIASFSSGVQELSSNVQTVASTALQISANMSEVTRAVSVMGDSIRSMDELAKNSSQTVGQAKIESDQARTIMRELEVSAVEIGEVTQMIKEISQQTNLLALNANIEAASAGEAGKGFAVVANEIKELANQSATAADDIAKKVLGIQNNSAHAVTAIGSIAETISTVDLSSQQILEATLAQTQQVATVENNIQEAVHGVEEVARLMEEASQTSSSMAKGAEELTLATREIAENINEVSKATKVTTQEANRVLGEAQGINHVVEVLTEVSGKFRLS